MKFDEWWTQEIGHPPRDDDERKVFLMAHLAWRAALSYGEWEPGPADVEWALKATRKAAGAETELVLRNRILIADMTIESLEAQMSRYDELRVELDARVAQERQVAPEGAKMLGGTRWQCPRCNFIAGIKRIELECRGCSYPGDDTRSWTQEAKEGDDGED